MKACGVCVCVSLKRKLSEGLYALQNPNLPSLTRNTGPSLISQFSGECNYVLLAESTQTLWPKTSAFQLGVFKIKRKGRGGGRKRAKGQQCVCVQVKRHKILAHNRRISISCQCSNYLSKLTKNIPACANLI